MSSEIVFDVKKVENKLFLALTLIVIFSVVYNLLPGDEIIFADVNGNDAGFFDVLYATILTQVGLYHPGSIKPLSTKAKVILLIQLVLAYGIFLL